MFTALHLLDTTHQIRRTTRTDLQISPDRIPGNAQSSRMNVDTLRTPRMLLQALLPLSVRPSRKDGLPAKRSVSGWRCCLPLRDSMTS